MGNRVQETTTTSGSGTYSLGGAVTGRLTFKSAVGSGNSCDYICESADGTAYEIGRGVVTSGTPDTLSRVDIYQSSNSNAAVVWPDTSSKNIYCMWHTDFVRFAKAGQFPVSGGSADALTLTHKPGLTKLRDGMWFIFKISGSTNTTTTPTLNIDGLGAKTLQRMDTGALSAGALIANSVVAGVYDSAADKIRIFSTFGNQVIADGTAALPAISFASAANLGIYKPTTNVFAIAAAGLDVARFTGQSSSVNYINFSSALTGVGPLIQAVGSDTNVDLKISSQGTGVVALFTQAGAVNQFNIFHTASAVNRFTVTGAVATGQPVLLADGSDTNVGSIFANKGTAGWVFKTGAGATTCFTIYGDTSITTGALTAVIDTTTGTSDGFSLNGTNNQTSMSINGNSVLMLRRRSSDGGLVEFRRDTTQVGVINVTTTSTSYVTSSDYRVKNSLEAIGMSGRPTAIETISKLKVYSGIFNRDPEQKRQLMFLAHEVQDVYPEAIVGIKDGIDEDGNPIYQGIDHSKLSPLFTAAIQELNTRLRAVEVRL